MKRYIYIRVSTLEQDFAQQKQCIDDYFTRNGIDPSIISKVVTEKHTGTDSHENRKFAELLKDAQSGDIIYVSELSRIGRNMSDLFNIASIACDKGKSEAEEIGRRTGVTPPYGVTIIQCKDGTQIENNSIGGKALLFAFAFVAEIEVSNLRHRTRMSLKERKERLRREGSFVSKSGKVCTKLGRPKGCDLTKAYTASCESRKNAAKEWRETSPAYQIVKRWVLQGYSSRWILNEISVLHKAQPDVYCTRKGLGFNLQTISLWSGKIKREFLAQADSS